MSRKFGLAVLRQPRRSCSVWGFNSEKVAAEAAFAAPATQALLLRLAGVDPARAFPERPQAEPRRAFYRLATAEDMGKLTAEAEARARQRLQPPPFKLARAPLDSVLAEDAEIAGLEPHKIIFADVSFGLSKRERSVVVREPDGTLRDGRHTERDRILNFLYPSPGRDSVVPPAFEGPSLQRNLDEQRHRHIMDFACVQFEPDDPAFIRVSKAIFEDVARGGKWDLLWGTRHQGSLLFYLALTRNVSKFLLHELDAGRAEEAALVVQLYAAIHKDALDLQNLSSHLAKIKEYTRKLAHNDSSKSALDIAIMRCEDRLKSEQLKATN